MRIYLRGENKDMEFETISLYLFPSFVTTITAVSILQANVIDFSVAEEAVDLTCCRSFIHNHSEMTSSAQGTKSPVMTSWTLRCYLRWLASQWA